MIFTTLNSDLIIEIIGYLGSAFVLGSFLLKDIKWIRIINIFGAIFFVIYGISTETWATAFMNMALVVVHIVYLVKIFSNKSKEQIEE